MGLVIDTSALVAIERSGEEASEVLLPYRQEPVVIPMIVWAELLAGVRLAKSEKVANRRRTWLGRLRSEVPLMEFTEEIAAEYADVFTECQQAGTPIPQNDVAVAATARHLNYGILVGKRGEGHFDKVRQVRIATLDL